MTPKNIMSLRAIKAYLRKNLKHYYGYSVCEDFIIKTCEKYDLNIDSQRQKFYRGIGMVFDEYANNLQKEMVDINIQKCDLLINYYNSIIAQ